ncbi:DUF1656 domain-containing protein [Roseococcus sp. YIM B11640]|uniref:DUF1656 domain-containing protein n=1 Tax=Roseococcus sp. YIM B11640 TaxID=3133973 RepID=UPI003C7AFE34
MPPEIDIYGVFVPSFLIVMVLAYGAMRLVSRLLARIGAYDFVWHRALFNVGLYVLILGGGWSLLRSTF